MTSKNGKGKHKKQQPKEADLARGVSAIRTLITGVPSRRTRIASWITIGVNLLLTSFAFDFLLRGQLLYSTDDLTFSRVGYVSPDTAKILVREPDATKLPIRASYQELQDGYGADLVNVDTIHSLDESTDFSSAIEISGLRPSTRYRYFLSNNKSGKFTTPSLPGTIESRKLSFVTSSCIKPNFPYNPLSHPFRIQGIEILFRVISQLPSFSRPEFMLFLGDFIYIDVPFRFGSSVSTYRNEYRKVYSSPSWTASSDPAVYLPWIHTLDDHEIANDWASGNKTAPYPAAAEPYLHYHVSVNPPIPEKSFAIASDTTYFSFTRGPAAFFVSDSRTYRSTPGQENSTILGHAQLQSLLHFISRPEPDGIKWKIISSGVPFTKNWQIGTQDTWGGFLRERRTVFDAIWRAERELGVRIVLLSGDRHEFGATRFPDPLLSSTATPPSANEYGPGNGIHEFSVGPLNMFYLPIRSYKQSDNEDITVKYAPDGNSKFGAIHIDTVGVDNVVTESVLTYSLYVDGEVAWKYKLSVPLQWKKGDILPDGEVLLDEIDDSPKWVKEVSGILDQWIGPLFRKTVERLDGTVEGLLKKERLSE